MVGSCDRPAGWGLPNFQTCHTAVTTGVPIPISAVLYGHARAGGGGAGGVLYIDALMIQPPGGVPTIDSVYYVTRSGFPYLQLVNGVYIPEPGTYISGIVLGVFAVAWRRLRHRR